MRSESIATPRLRRPWRISAIAALGALAISSLILLPAPAAHAASAIVVSPQPSTEGATSVTLSGSGFQYLPNAPGGIYVMFGVVSDPVSWAPSKGGASGVTYSYSSVEGSILLVGFEGGSEAEGSDVAIDANGNWTGELTIPGPSFQLTAGRTGEAAGGDLVNCLEQTCGIITIGAMGSVNANNESFTPVTFVEPAAETAPEPTTGPEPADAADEDAAESGVSATDSSADAAEDDQGPGILPWLIGAGIIVLAGAAAWGAVASRKSRAAKQTAAGASDASSGSDDNES